MKAVKTICRLFAALCVLSAAAPWVTAQSNDEERDIVAGYAAGKLNGMLVTILRVEKESLSAIEPQHVFKEGDKIKVALESNFKGYVYIVNYGSSGVNRVIFPARGEQNLLAAGRVAYLPQTYPLQFDGHTGIEVLRVFLALRPLAFLEAAVKRRDGVLSERDAAAMDKLWSASGKQQTGIVTNELNVKHSPAAARAAETRAPIWNERKKSSLITLRRRRLQPGKVMVFGVNFNNAGRVK